MNNIKYILAVAFLGVFMGVSAQNVKGVVTVTDEPVKGAEIVSNNEVVATTNAEGEFVIHQKVSEVSVNYKKLSTNYSFESLGYANIVLVPSEDKMLKMMDKKPSLEKCNIFLANYPESAAIAEVNQQKEELTFIKAYDKAVTDYEVDGLDAYVAAYPNGEFASKAIQTMEVISWQFARLQDTPESYNEFLARYPESKAAQEATNRMANLQDENK